LKTDNSKKHGLARRPHLQMEVSQKFAAKGEKKVRRNGKNGARVTFHLRSRRHHKSTPSSKTPEKRPKKAKHHVVGSEVVRRVPRNQRYSAEGTGEKGEGKRGLKLTPGVEAKRGQNEKKRFHERCF